MLTVDFSRFPLAPGDLVLDLGCGAGRHAFECYRRGARVVALDRSAEEVREVAAWLAAMREAGEAPAGAAAAAVEGDALTLPFPDGTFDAVIVSEVLEHIPDDKGVLAETIRVLRPGGRMAVTVPRYGPERICWALSDAYHEVEGGHIRIYRADELLDRLREAGLRPYGTHHAHGLHSPYWWLKCALGVDNDRALPVRAYHRLLVWDIVKRPPATRLAERVLDPLIGKSFVAYATKPHECEGGVWTDAPAVPVAPHALEDASDTPRTLRTAGTVHASDAVHASDTLRTGGTVHASDIVHASDTLRTAGTVHASDTIDASSRTLDASDALRACAGPHTCGTPRTRDTPDTPDVTDGLDSAAARQGRA